MELLRETATRNSNANKSKRRPTCGRRLLLRGGFSKPSKLKDVAFGEFHFYSPALGKATSGDIIVPEIEGQNGPFPVLYLLHGLSDDHTIWQRRTSLERYVQALPLIVVMPNGGRGWYSDAFEGYAYQSAIINDLIGFVDRTLRTVPDKSGRCIGGLSMGGYGAIKLAMKFPELFVSANGHSGAYAFGHAPNYTKNAEFTRIIGPQPSGGPQDLWKIAAELAPAEAPALRIDCGTSDFLIDQNRDFHAHLEKLGIAHQYEEFPGAHDWAYWDRHVQSALRFHAGHLGISKPLLKGQGARSREQG